ncbi:hypothetical protein F5Y11DRAFT_322948 [Daldinia sp. FL1419]|nr:hypothetical protein F5Y11DRAFT_322948 [Daldinia sp. FL1419]
MNFLCHIFALTHLCLTITYLVKTLSIQESEPVFWSHRGLDRLSLMVVIGVRLGGLAESCGLPVWDDQIRSRVF